MLENALTLLALLAVEAPSPVVTDVGMVAPDVVVPDG